jgi:Lon protease-like protein
VNKHLAPLPDPCTTGKPFEHLKIPLFPLDVVLFPGLPLPLHIFEPRYRQMIAECLVADVPFGVVRAQRDGLAVVGCTAQVLRILQSYPDGRSDILTQGIDRFEIEQLIDRDEDNRGFLQAEVDLIPDTGEPAARSAREECVALHFEALHLLGAGQPSMHLNLDAPVAYLLAASMPADLNFQQALLAMRSDAERTETLLTYYRAALPKLRSGAKASKRGSANGHIM